MRVYSRVSAAQLNLWYLVELYIKRKGLMVNWCFHKKKNTEYKLKSPKSSPEIQVQKNWSFEKMNGTEMINFVLLFFVSSVFHRQYPAGN